MRCILTITDKDITGSEALSSAAARLAVNAVLFDEDNRIALNHVGRFDLLTLPGGGVEAGEALHAALKREMLEETGCHCEIFGELGQILENRAKHNFTQDRRYYMARVVGAKGNLHLTDQERTDDTTVVWLPIQQALRMIAEKKQDDYQRKFLQRRDIAALQEALLWLQLHNISDCRI